MRGRCALHVVVDVIFERFVVVRLTSLELSDAALRLDDNVRSTIDDVSIRIRLHLEDVVDET